MAASDHLWWTSNGAVLALLQGHDASSPEQAKKQLDSHFDWLLNGTASFQQPSEASRKLLNDNKAVTIKGKKFAIEPLLRPATLKLSLLLDLDELQAHILLKRWLRDTGQDTLLEGTAPGTQVDFGLDAMLQVLAYYHEERLMLLKCTQYVLLQGVHEKMYTQLCERLVKSGIEEKVFSAVRSNMDAGGPGAYVAAATAVMAPGTIAGRMAAVMKEFSPAGNMGWLSAVHTSLLEQLQRERSELFSLLLLMYELPSPPLGLRCSSHRVLELGSMLGSATFSSASPSAQLQAAAPGAPPPASPAALAEQLGCLLLLSVLDLPAYIRLTSAPPPGPAAPTPLDGLLPLGGKVRDLHGELRGWRGSETNAALLLTWSAVVKLLEPYVDLGESSVEELQARAFQAGGFGATAACLRQQSGLLSSALGQIQRRVLLRALCLTCTAFELGPSRLSAEVFAQLVDLISALAEGDEAMCEMVWDPTLDLTEPLRDVVRDAASLFPAELGPTVQLLKALSAGPAAAAAAYAFLQSQPRLAVLHNAADGAVPEPGPDGQVVLRRPVVWNQAPSVTTMVLPEGVEGHEVPLPGVLSHLEGQSQRLVVWDVRGGEHSSFGQLLLLGRAAHCVRLLERSAAGVGGAGIDGGALRDLQGALQLMAALCGQQPSLVADLMSLKVDLDTGAAATWLDVAAGAAAALCQLPDMAAVSGAFAPCLQLLRQLAWSHPTQVMGALQRVAMLCPASAAEGLVGPSGQTLPALPLATLPVQAPQAGQGIFQGLLPSFRASYQEAGSRQGHYPELLAFLDLVSELLRARHTGGPLAAYVLWVLHELLPSHPLLPFRSADARWAVTAAILKVLRLSVEAGVHMAAPATATPQPSSTASGAASLNPASSSAAATAAPSPAARWEPHVTPLAAHVLSQLLLHGPALLAPCLPPPAADLDAQRAADPASPAVEAVESSCSELLRLLPLLTSAARTYPNELPLEEFLFFAPGASGLPPAALLTTYLAYSQPEVAALNPEASLSYQALKALQALQACVARPVSRALLAGLSMGRVVPRGGPAQEALRAMFRPDAAVEQPHHFLLAAEVLEAAVQDSSELLDVLLFPCGLEEELEGAAQEAQGAASGAPALTAGSAATPAGGQGAAQGATPGTAAAASAAGAGTGAGASSAVVPAGAAPQGQAGKKKPAAPPAFSVLDGLAELLAQAGSLRKEAPEVLCSTLRAVCALWQHQGLAPWPAALLRGTSGLWSALEFALGLSSSSKATPGATATSGKGAAGSAEETGEAGAWLQLAEAYAWQVLMLEVYLVPRPSSGAASAPATPAATPSAPTPGSGSHAREDAPAARVWTIVDGVLDSGLMAGALRRCCKVLDDRRPLQRLVLLVQALYLELGAYCLGGVLGEGSAGEDTLAVSAAARFELAALRDALQQSLSPQDLAYLRTASGQPGWDVGAVHTALTTAAAALATDRSSPSAAAAALSAAAAGPLGERLVRAPLGSTLLGFTCPVPELTMEAVRYGGGYLLSPQRLDTLLGPLAQCVPSAGPLADAYAQLGTAASVASARLSALQAVCALAAVLPRDARCLSLIQSQATAAAADAPQQAAAGSEPATPSAQAATPAGTADTGSSSASLLDAALHATQSAVTQLLEWDADPASPQLAAWPTAALLQYSSDAAVTSCKLLLHTLTALRAPSPSSLARGGSGGALVLAGPPGSSAGGSGTPSAALAFPYGAPRQAPIPEARTLFPATPPPRTGRATATASASGGAGGTPSSGAGAAASSVAVAALGACLPLASLLNTWLRAAASGNLGASNVPSQAALQVVDTLGSCTLLALQAARAPLAAALASPSASAVADVRSIQGALAAALPSICRLCAIGSMALPVGVQLVAEAVGRLLSPGDWLPALREQMDVTSMLLQAAAQAAASAEGGAPAAAAAKGLQPDGELGLLQLSILVAQAPEGSRMLHEQGALDRLAALARYLLASRGGGLAPFTSLEFPAAMLGGGVSGGWDAAAASSTRPFLPPAPTSPSGPAAAGGEHVDVAYAYDPRTGAWSPAHQQWCMLLSFSSVLTRTLSQHVDVESAAIELLAAAEPRLLLACVPPAASAAQPLSLASLFELERTLFLLQHLLRYSGTWHMALPGSLPRFRTAVSAFVAFAAMPNTSKAFGISCPPQSPAERHMAVQPTGLPRTEGWFRTCSLGAQMAPSAGSSVAAGGGGSTHPSLAGHCSEYAGRMAELMYSCLHQALTFLLASSPQLGEAEAASLGPMWPRPRDLAALQDQCMAVLYSMADTPRAGGVEGGGRRKHICQGVLKVLQLLADFLDALSYPAGRRDAERSMREQLLAVEAALSAGDMLPRPLAPLVPLSPSVSLSSSLVM